MSLVCFWIILADNILVLLMFDSLHFVHVWSHDMNNLQTENPRVPLETGEGLANQQSVLVQLDFESFMVVMHWHSPSFLGEIEEMKSENLAMWNVTYGS